MKVKLTRPAREELRKITEWIGADSPSAANRFLGRLHDACMSLSDFPERYATDARIGLRKMPVAAYLVFYRITDQVEIMRVLNAAQDWPEMLGNDA